MIENTCDSNQKSVFALSGVKGNDAGLTIHAQDGRVGRINRECVSHTKLLWHRALKVRTVAESLNTALSR